MEKNFMQPHEEWLFKAEHDLKSSKVLMSHDEPLLDIAIYHTQQCGEKSLKAFLSFHREELSKTHNLTVLLDSCIEIDNSFDSLFDDCIFLNPFATLFRYPEGDLTPKLHEVSGAVSSAQRIFDFVSNKIKY